MVWVQPDPKKEEWERLYLRKDVDIWGDVLFNDKDPGCYLWVVTLGDVHWESGSEWTERGAKRACWDAMTRCSIETPRPMEE